MKRGGGNSHGRGRRKGSRPRWVRRGGGVRGGKGLPLIVLYWTEGVGRPSTWCVEVLAAEEEPHEPQQHDHPNRGEKTG